MSAFAATNLEKFIDFPSHAACSSRSRNTSTSDPCVFVFSIFCRIVWCAARRGFLWLWFWSLCWFLFTNFTTGLEESLKRVHLFILSFKFRITRESSLLCTKALNAHNCTKGDTNFYKLRTVTEKRHTLKDVAMNANKDCSSHQLVLGLPLILVSFLFSFFL